MKDEILEVLKECTTCQVCNRKKVGRVRLCSYNKIFRENCFGFNLVSRQKKYVLVLIDYHTD